MTKSISKHVLTYMLWVFLICVPFLPWLIREIDKPPLREQGIEVAVQGKLRNTFVAILVYLNKNGNYPSAENWQDLLLPYLDNRKDALKLPTKVNITNTIALNLKAKPDSPKDVVLLFESTGGWNAYGQSELLAPTSNGKPGCFIVFNDGYIEFISPQQAKNLNWGNNP